MKSAAKPGLAALLAACLLIVFSVSAFAAERGQGNRPQGNRGQEQGQGQRGRQAPPEEIQPVVDFSRMMREVEALRRFAGNEADAALQEMAKDKQSLTTGIASLKRQKAATEKEVIRLQGVYLKQMERLAELEAIEKADRASRKALEGATRLTAGTIRERLAFMPYTSIKPEMTDTVMRIMASGSFPGYNDIKAVTEILFAELGYISSASILPGSVTLASGAKKDADILRVGGMLAAASLKDGGYIYLQPVEGGKRLLEIQAEIPSSVVKLAEKAFAPGATSVPADFSEGGVYKRFIGQRSVTEHILAGGLLIWPILGLGIGAFIFGVWRYARLLKIRFGNHEVLAEFFHLVRGGKLDNAKKLLEEKKEPNVPVYAVLLHMLSEWGKGNVTSMEKCRDEAIMGQLTPLEKGVAFVAVVAAVAPLLGLLGTVTGMIGTFDVITIFGNSDPKLLSGGISVALVTTELGLCVAIPLMFLHFMLSRRVSSLVDDMEEKGAVLIARTSAGLTA